MSAKGRIFIFEGLDGQVRLRTLVRYLTHWKKLVTQ